jgi:1-acyl-sn-glycerol-3-phosphate acyltransferase
MSGPTWHDAAPAPRRIGALGWALVVLRGAPMAALVFGGLALLLAIRGVERPLHGLHRPWTPHLTRAVCRGALSILGLRLRAEGQPMTGEGAVVANHSSWLDIFVLNAADTVYFVAKSEVAGWPGIGWLARATGTLFIRRDPREAGRQQAVFRERLEADHRLLFFPEGTSTDGRRVLEFKSTLFGSFFTDRLKPRLHLQAVTVIYHAPPGADPRFYGWWGDMDFGTHLLQMLAAPRHGSVEVVYHPPVAVAAHDSRKALAGHLGAEVRATLKARLRP